MAWIEKRGTKWRVGWDIGTPEERQKRYESFDSHDQAEQFYHKVEYEMSIGTYINVTKMTVGEYFDHWLRLHGDKLAPMTLHSYQHQIKNHIKPNLGSHKLSKLSPLHLEDYYVHQLKEGRIEQLQRELIKAKDKQKDKIQKRIDNTKSPGLSPTSVLYQHKIIHKALKQAVKWQMVSRNVADAVDPPKKFKKEIIYLGKNDLNTFLKVIKESVDYPVIFAAAMTGMRQGELLGLRWSDVDLDTGIITVSLQMQYLPSSGFFFKEPKQHSKRLIPMPLPLNVQLRNLVKVQENYKKVYGDEYQNKDLIFCCPDGSPIDGIELTKRFQALLVKNGLPKIRFHSLRHTFATLSRSAGVPLEDIQDLLGHKDISTTKSLYTHTEIEPLKKSIDMFTEYLAN